MQESHSAAITALQAELADSKQETLSAKAAGDFSVKEAVLGADKKVQRLTERTAKASCFLFTQRDVSQHGDSTSSLHTSFSSR
jgi:hypothetical protein